MHSWVVWSGLVIMVLHAAPARGGPRVRRPTAGPIHLTLSGYQGDLDLIVSATSAQGACIADVRWTDYIVVVDGSAGVASPFSLQVSCP